MAVVTVYSRVGCHLCAEAEAVARAVVAETGSAHEVRVIDVDADPALVDAYTVRVPVVAVDGVEIAQYQLDPTALRQALARTA
jgi:glutaredoxin